jgi:hypothetical protein
MTEAELKATFPNASPAFIRRNARESRGVDLQPDGAGPAAVVEHDPGYGAVAAIQVEKRTSGHFLARVTAIRKRLLDEDNLCEKYIIDLCRYAGAIPGDSPATTRIEVSQQKAGPKEPEETRIEIYRLE